MGTRGVAERPAHDLVYRFLEERPVGDSPSHTRRLLERIVAGVDRLAVATSFQPSGLVTLDLLRSIGAKVPVLFLDTGFHFEETTTFRRRIARMWHLEVIELRGDHGHPQRQAELFGSNLFERDPDMCCHINKVQPLQRALEGFDGWISGLRRDQAPSREAIPLVGMQRLPSGREVLKFHPLAYWSKEGVQAFIDRRHIPTHPLQERGFPSIGCRPCTGPVPPGGEDRAGRWPGSPKFECGIHSFGRLEDQRETEEGR